VAQGGFVATISQGRLASDALRESSTLRDVGQQFGSPAGRERDWQMLRNNLVMHLYHPQNQLATFTGDHLATAVSAMVDNAVHKLLVYRGNVVPKVWLSSESKSAELGKQGWQGAFTALDLTKTVRALELRTGVLLEPDAVPAPARALAASAGVNTQEQAAAYTMRTLKARRRALLSIAAVASSVLGIRGGEAGHDFLARAIKEGWSEEDTIHRAYELMHDMREQQRDGGLAVHDFHARAITEGWSEEDTIHRAYELMHDIQEQPPPWKLRDGLEGAPEQKAPAVVAACLTRGSA
jgi:hypothetical protein